MPKDLLNLDISEINVTINNISSLKDSISIDKDLTIDFKAKLISTPIETYIKMPYNSADGRFFFRAIPLVLQILPFSTQRLDRP